MADSTTPDDDMPPPLEDMSDMLQQLEVMKEIKSQKQQSNANRKATVKEVTEVKFKGNTKAKVELEEITEPVEAKKTDVKPTPPKQSTALEKGGAGAFGGMKKGFLFGGGGGGGSVKQAPLSKPKKSKQEEIPFIKPKATQKEEFQLPEVQRAMDAAKAFQDNQDWITEDLLSNVRNNEDLAKRFADPRFMAAVTEFQTNPTAAMQKYAGNPEMTKFLKDFCGLMGAHFNKMADQQERQASSQSPSKASHPIVTTDATSAADMTVRSSTDPKQPTYEDEQRMQQLINDPEIRNILVKPEVQNMFQMLRSDPNGAQSMLRRAHAGLQQDIQKLVKCGLLQFER